MPLEHRRDVYTPFNVKIADYLPNVIPPAVLDIAPLHAHYHSSGDAIQKTTYLLKVLRDAHTQILTHEPTPELADFHQQLPALIAATESLHAHLEANRHGAVFLECHFDRDEGLVVRPTDPKCVTSGWKVHRKALPPKQRLVFGKRPMVSR